MRRIICNMISLVVERMPGWALIKPNLRLWDRRLKPSGAATSSSRQSSTVLEHRIVWRSELRGRSRDQRRSPKPSENPGRITGLLLPLLSAAWNKGACVNINLNNSVKQKLRCRLGIYLDIPNQWRLQPRAQLPVTSDFNLVGAVGIRFLLHVHLAGVGWLLSNGGQSWRNESFK